MNKKVLFIALFILMISCFKSSCLYSQTNQIQEPLQGHAIFVPAGISVNAVLSTEINSKNAIIGQTIDAILTEDFLFNNILIAPTGSVIQGTIVSNKKATYGNINAKTEVKFTNIRTPYNNIIPINASIMTNDLSGTLKGATAKDSLKDYAKNTALGAGSGAIFGTIAGAIRDNVGKGAIYGTAIGAGMGVIKGASEKGEDIIIPSNSQISIYFNQPITLNAQ